MMRLHVACAMAVALATFCATLTAHAADTQAERRERERARQREIQRRRGILDNQIRAGELRLKQVRQQLAQLKQNLPNMQIQYEEMARAAEQHKSEVIQIQGEIEVLRPNLAAANAEVNSAREKMDTVMAEWQQSLPADHPLRQAQHRLETAQQKYDAELNSVLESPRYKQELQAAKAHKDPIKAAEVRATHLRANTRLPPLEGELKANREKYNQLRTQFLADHSPWRLAQEKFQLAQDHLRTINQQWGAVNEKLNLARVARDTKTDAARKMASAGRQAQTQAAQLDASQRLIARQLGQLRKQRSSLR